MMGEVLTPGHLEQPRRTGGRREIPTESPSVLPCTPALGQGGESFAGGQGTTLEEREEQVQSTEAFEE